MKTSRILLPLFATWLGLPAVLHAQVVTDLHDFGGPNDGRNPQGSLLLSGNMMYGMTTGGGVGPFASGTVFGMGLNGSNYSILHTFNSGLNDGDTPNGSLVQVGSTLYGMTEGGGTGGHGIIFSVGTDSTGFTVLHRFTGGPGDGSVPRGSLVLSGSTLYGMTSSGGDIPTPNGLYQNGTIFKLNLDGSGYTILHNLAGYPTDGQGPQGGALALSGDTVYGMTLFGGTGPAGTVSAGTVFKMNTDGSGYTVLRTFTAGADDGGSPQGQLIVSGSKLYGFTEHGGISGHGVLFSMDLNGNNFNLMHSFQSFAGDGELPVGEPTVVGSTLYGTTVIGGTNSLGTILGIGLDGTNYAVDYSFTGGPGDGAGPVGQLQFAESELFGMTGQGGLFNDGIIFGFTTVPEPSSLALLLAAGGGAIAWAVRRRQRTRVS